MLKITLTVGVEEIEITQATIRIAYHSFSHDEFNSIIAAYRLLGFYRDVALSLAPKDSDTAILVEPEPTPEEIV